MRSTLIHPCTGSNVFWTQQCRRHSRIRTSNNRIHRDTHQILPLEHIGERTVGFVLSSDTPSPSISPNNIKHCRWRRHGVLLGRKRCGGIATYVTRPSKKKTAKVLLNFGPNVISNVYFIWKFCE